MTNHSEETVKAKVKNALDRTIDQGDKKLLDRFAQIRSEALKEIPEKSSAKHRFFSFPTIGLASAAAIIFASLIIFFPKDDALDSNIIALTELDVLTEGEDIEMLETLEPEFYLWLETEIEAG